jgi:hypothetical protein
MAPLILCIITTKAIRIIIIVNLNLRLGLYLRHNKRHKKIIQISKSWNMPPTKELITIREKTNIIILFDLLDLLNKNIKTPINFNEESR